MNLVHELKKQGWSKWKIAQKIGVTWQTIHRWDRAWGIPSLLHQTQLEKCLQDAKHANASLNPIGDSNSIVALD